MTTDRPGISFDARDHEYVHEEHLAKPAAPPSGAFLVRFEASGVVGPGDAESIPETTDKRVG